MFSSAILDVAIGLIFCYLTVSLVASAVLEALSSMMTWRSKDLRQGIQQMVNDPGFTGLALDLYQHAAINPRGSLTGAALAQNGNAVDLARPPAYIAPAQFAAALMDILGLSTAGQPAAMPANVDAGLKAANPQIHALVSGIVQRAGGDLTVIKTELAGWFDNAMDRLSGAYKRKAQLVSFLVALILSATLNIDTIRVAHELWNHPALAEDLKLPPEVASPAPNDVGAAPVTGTRPRVNTDAQAGERMIGVLDKHLPVGWQMEVSSLQDHPWQWVAMLFGWLITAVAALFGAPFWFDTLQSIIRLKGAGPSPAEKVEGRAASA